MNIIDSPSALMATALAELVGAVIPDDFDFVLIVERVSRDDLAVRANVAEHEHAVTMVRVAATVMGEQAPVDLNEPS